MIYSTKEEIFIRAKEAVGQSFGEMAGDSQRSEQELNKGYIGNLVQEAHFGYKINSRSEPDFVEAGVELKVTPYKRVNGKITAKERLVLNIIDFKKEVNIDFYSSSFWTKNKSILLMFYQYEPLVPKSQWFVSHVYFWDIERENELYLIKEDWMRINQMILTGQAHKLSESLTLYLGACTKGANKDSTREQPFSTIKAMQRAYCIKSPFMSVLVNEVISEKRLNAPSIDLSKETSTHIPFETEIETKLAQFVSRKRTDLISFFGIEYQAKNLNAILVAKMLGIEGSINHTAEFIKAGIVTKTIVANLSGKVKESMSFPPFRFSELCDEESWEVSEINRYFSSTKFFLVVFQSNENEELVFRGTKFWGMPHEDLEKYQEVWSKAVMALKKCDPQLFPRASQSDVGHVRPHAKNKLDVDSFSDGTASTKRCFWLNNSYIEKQIYNLLSNK